MQTLHAEPEPPAPPPAKGRSQLRVLALPNLRPPRCTQRKFPWQALAAEAKCEVKDGKVGWP